jgi:hypothetical protein
MALSHPSSSSLCFAVRFFSIFVMLALLFSWCSNDVLVVCSGICARIRLESLFFPFSFCAKNSTIDHKIIY